MNHNPKDIKARIIALLERSGQEEYIDTGDAVDLLRQAAEVLAPQREPHDVLNDVLTAGEDVKVLFELRTAAQVAEEYPLAETLNDSMTYVRATVLTGPAQEEQVWFGVDVYDVLQDMGAPDLGDSRRKPCETPCEIEGVVGTVACSDVMDNVETMCGPCREVAEER